MKKIFILLILSFVFGLFLVHLITYASQTNMNTYYPSPSGTYTKVHLMNGSSGVNQASCFCAQSSNGINETSYSPPSGVTSSGACDTGDSAAGGIKYINAGTIFADPTTGYLEICKNDGSVSSYPGACFTRFGGSPSCPSNYIVTGRKTNGLIASWSCCFTGQGNTGSGFTDIQAAGVTAKSGCFSIYGGSGGTPPPSCTSKDTNAYDVGCKELTTTSAVRTCCFNNPSGGSLTGVSSCATCAGGSSTCPAG